MWRFGDTYSCWFVESHRRRNIAHDYKKFEYIQCTLPKTLATIDGQIVDPEFAVEFKMHDAPKMHSTET